LGNEYPPRRFASPDGRGELELQPLCAAMVQRANHAFATLFMERAETSCLMRGDVDDARTPTSAAAGLAGPESKCRRNLATTPSGAILQRGRQVIVTHSGRIVWPLC
jgi:hypothetical protein